MAKWRGPYRDDKVHVMAEKCSTCVFRPGNLMDLKPGRVKDLVRGNLDDESALICHKTLAYSPGQPDGAICSGFFDAYAQDSTTLRLAIAMDIIERVSLP